MTKVMKTMDGNTAASYVSYAFTDVAAIYPITPSSDMAENVDVWAAEGKKNLFGQEVLVKEMQSEGGAAGAVHGSLQAGALTTTYTASQGLLLMIPNMYKIAGELLPCVFHVSARAIASHALSIFGDHQDVMATRQTGFAMLASGSVQEVMDLAGVAHLSSIKGRVPFVHFFDGFRTSHEIQKIEVMEYEELGKLLDKDALREFRARALNPENPVTRGTAQNPDVYFQAAEASNPYYENIGEITYDYMKEISKITGREYKPFNYYGHPEAERVIVAMGSVTETIEETVDYLLEKGEKVGVIKVHLYRPFVADYFFDVLPSTVKKIAVLDRTKEKGAIAEPLHLDVNTIFFNKEQRPVIVGGRYGLGSKDTTPSQIFAVFNNLNEDNPRDRFTIGIVDDVTHKSLEVKDIIKTELKETIKCKFWGFGSDGTVGANKQAIKIIGDDTDMYAQGYFSYDSKKSGGITVSHLRFGHEPIKSTYLISDADFISCSKQSYVYQYDLLKGLKDGGSFLLNCIWDKEELDDYLPGEMKKYIADHNIDFYTINATKIAAEIGLGARINMVMQAAFFKLSKVLPLDEAISHLKKSIVDAYGTKGEAIVNMNYEAVDKGIGALVKVDVPEYWKDAKGEEQKEDSFPEFINEILIPMNRQEGGKLPVSIFTGDRVDGTFPHGTSAFEKRCIAIEAPQWKIENCIQCNQCAYVCPHAVVRPFLLDEEEKAAKPDTFETKKAMGKGMEKYDYRIQVSVLDCTGCGNCAEVCPAKEKALVMVPFEEEYEVQSKNWEFATTIKTKEDPMPVTTLKGSQFRQPLLEFSGACAGCGETAYAKLVTQLFGDRMYIANATGCSSIWGGSAPATPYCKNQEGKGPAWANSLFEDNAEYGYGMAIAVKQIRNKIQILMEEFISLNVESELNEYFTNWLENMKDEKATKAAAGMILPRLEIKLENERANEILQEIAERKDYLVKKSIWIFGGDGWAYDIDFGGLDHVLASGEDINILVFDTEVYSNTGGQSSKSTPIGAVAKFAASGKEIRKKDLGIMMTTYGYIYTAQISMGANMNQTLKAINEAESYDGPSLVIAYSPCINHGIRSGMGTSVRQEKRAVDSGYWHLYRFDPRLKDQGKNPFQLDSKEPTEPFMDFINSEVRYTSLRKTFPEMAEELFVAAENNAKKKYESYKRMAEQE
ncbi:pyruvate:ferredoxin (flavodoxin) oxidoreductase [Tissierella creatinophila]|uniref:Pyruvate-flavodoxin oxidoreductase n=1 Tax=Tissierella creatinophila DSM 6911 TaxID=1123403 RepID=A0A1U7M7N0_TISCR|nr:pyruvate:ferredoxin (flavodoxin) oxidoreductase [Tissierella creatinophila]OLS03291.1 pyruvate-flavodoxin oxidoreductase [Tissierella creatinophila DSM 6911]